jgi:hypothetical protein
MRNPAELLDFCGPVVGPADVQQSGHADRIISQPAVNRPKQHQSVTIGHSQTLPRPLSPQNPTIRPACARAVRERGYSKPLKVVRGGGRFGAVLGAPWTHSDRVNTEARLNAALVARPEHVAKRLARLSPQNGGAT